MLKTAFLTIRVVQWLVTYPYLQGIGLPFLRDFSLRLYRLFRLETLDR